MLVSETTQTKHNNVFKSKSRTILKKKEKKKSFSGKIKHMQRLFNDLFSPVNIGGCDWLSSVHSQHLTYKYG